MAAAVERKFPLRLQVAHLEKIASGEITADMLRRCRQRSPGLWVVATISTARYRT